MYILSTGQFLGTAKHVKNNGRQEKNKIDFFCFGNTVFLFHKRPTLRESQTFYDIYIFIFKWTFSQEKSQFRFNFLHTLYCTCSNLQ